MDTDPLRTDAPAPRHVIESDDEEDGVDDKEPTFEVVYNGPRGKPLLIAFGDQARGVGAAGAVSVRGQQIASISDGVVVCGPLPHSLQSSFARALIAELQPSRVAVVDSYPYQTYIGADGTGPAVRYLSNIPIPSPPLPFAPPNIHSSTSAAILCILSARTPPIPAVLFLLPSPLVAPQPPRDLLQALSHPIPRDLDISPARSHISAFLGRLNWSLPPSHHKEGSRRIQHVEAGMYI
ncbi:hypothetical protein BD779DRAFT_1677676 [Infundibulicybe gibba]|nr:hypothetical protein BD779DRAFT_1677676 [Infundibulicybe gibba]